MPVSEEKTTAYQATESERAIIGAILRGDILPRNIELTLEDFTDLICHEVFAVMQKLDAQNKTCDLVTVSDAMPNFDSTLLVDLLQSGMPSLVLCDQYDDKPVGGSDPYADNFTFGGKHCLNDMGCMFVLDKETAVPAPVLNKYEVSGMAGTLRFERAELMLKERKVSGKLYFVNREQEGARLTDEQVARRMHDVAAWLLQAGRAELVMDADISRSIMAEIEDEASLTCDKWENGVMDISFTEQPLWQDAAMSTATQAVSLAAGTWQTIDLSKVFPRGMGYTTPLTLDVMNTGSAAILDFRIRYRDRLGKQRQTRLYGGGFSLTGGQSLRVDGENLSVVCGGQSMISALCEGDFPSVSPNAVNIEIMSASAAAASVTVSARARWL